MRSPLSRQPRLAHARAPAAQEATSLRQTAQASRDHRRAPCLHPAIGQPLGTALQQAAKASVSSRRPPCMQDANRLQQAAQASRHGRSGACLHRDRGQPRAPALQQAAQVSRSCRGLKYLSIRGFHLQQKVQFQDSGREPCIFWDCSYDTMIRNCRKSTTACVPPAIVATLP